MKRNEARIILYLANTSARLHDTTSISDKLGIDYAYLLKTLRTMTRNEQVSKVRRGNKFFYSLLDTSLKEVAMSRLGGSNDKIKTNEIKKD